MPSVPGVSTPRHELRPPARIGRDREDAVVRQRLHAVTRSGRPALAWHPATGPLAQLDPPTRGLDGDASWSELLGTVPGGGGPSGVEPRSGDAGWLPARPGTGEREAARDGDEPWPDMPGLPVVPGHDATSGETAQAPAVDDAVGRMRRRAAQTAASAYAAAHGHPTAHSGFAGLVDEGRPRWSLRPRTAVVALVAVLALAAGVVALQLPSGGVEPVAKVGDAVGATAETPEAAAEREPGASEPSPSPAEVDPAARASGEAPGGVVVHVVGQVAAPGLVTVPPDARVADALDAAGGATPDADLAALNLARAVTDGEQIVVPRPGEVVAAPDASGPVAGADPGPAGGVLDLNSVDAAALDALPGIGPVLAERIVAWRDENGPFTSVDELGEVSGIGPAVLADVRDLVRV